MGSYLKLLSPEEMITATIVRAPNPELGILDFIIFFLQLRREMFSSVLIHRRRRESCGEQKIWIGPQISLIQRLCG